MSAEALIAHLKTGHTTVCSCWALTRTDGTVLGFTDHDREITFEGITFAADGGMSAQALDSKNGLAVDNTEALGVLSHVGIKAEDIRAGRYDGAEIVIWQVNWAKIIERRVVFRGSLGEITEGAGAFQAELRGVSEALSQPQGRVFQKPCSAVLGQAGCGFDLATPGYRTEVTLVSSEDARVLRFAPLVDFDLRWFERGKAEVLTGQAAGLVAIIKNDRWLEDGREIELWQGLRLPLEAGDLIRLEAGCDKRAETCRLKFQNLLNYQGFPHVPGEDWLMSYPVSAGVNDGGSLI